MTSLGRLIFFDQPGTGVSDPITAGALPTLELWADSITAVLDDLGSREAVLLASTGSVATGALFAATHPSRTAALVVLEGYADPIRASADGGTPEETRVPPSPCGARASASMSTIRTCRGTRRSGLRGLVRTARGKPTNRCAHEAAAGRSGRAGGASHSPRPYTRRPSHRRPGVPPQRASTSPSTYRARNMLRCRAATCTTSSNRVARVLPGDRRIPDRPPTRGGRRSGSRYGALHRHRGLDGAGPRRSATVTGMPSLMHTTPSPCPS